MTEQLNNNNNTRKGEGKKLMGGQLVKIWEGNLLLYPFIFKNFFIGVQLIYNIVLVSSVQQNEPVIHVHISALF